MLLEDGLPDSDVANNGLSSVGHVVAVGGGSLLDYLPGYLNGLGDGLDNILAVKGGHVLAALHIVPLGGHELVIDPGELGGDHPRGGVADLPLVLEAFPQGLGRADGCLQGPSFGGRDGLAVGRLLLDAGLLHSVLALRDVGGLALLLVDRVAALATDAAVLVGHPAALVGHLAGAEGSHGCRLATHAAEELSVGVVDVLLRLGLRVGVGLGERLGDGVGIGLGVGPESDREGAHEEEEQGLQVKISGSDIMQRDGRSLIVRKQRKWKL